MPAILILGFDLELTRVAMVAVLGGLLGILMMIPLRRALIVKEHGILKYPEGTACAAVLKAGASADDRAALPRPPRKPKSAPPKPPDSVRRRARRPFLRDSVIGLLYKVAYNCPAVCGRTCRKKIFGAPLNASGSVSVEVSPELLGVGYIIGPRIASIMCAGGVLSYLMLIPMIKFFGEGLAGPLAPGTVPISGMGPDQIRHDYVLYIGAGAVTAGGIISLLRSLPTIWHGLVAGLRDARRGPRRRRCTRGENTSPTPKIPSPPTETCR